MAYTGTYEQALRKNPTDYKLRAMGKKKYDLKRRKDGKVAISTKGEPKTREDFGVGKKRAIDSNKKKTLLKKGGVDREARLALEREREQEKQKSSKQREVKTSKDDVRKTDNEGERKRKIESQNKQRKDVSIPSQALENLATGTAAFSLLAGGYGVKKFKEAKNRQKLQTAMNKIKDLPKDQQKEVGKKIGEKMAEKMKNAKPSLKQKIKTQLTKLKQKLASGLKSKLTVKTGGRTGAPAGMGVGGTAFGGKDFDGRRKKTIF